MDGIYCTQALMPFMPIATHARRERVERPRRAGVRLEHAGYSSRAALQFPLVAGGYDKGDKGKRNRQAAGASIPWPLACPGARGRVP